MCGIGGCVLQSGTDPDPNALMRMARALGHRGPDDSGIEIRGTVGLVNTRLAIVDTSPAGHQPMVDSGARWVLAYNGEIYNHMQLRRALPAAAYRGRSDTETLLHAVAEWGAVPASARCNGFFAFAALDTAERSLYLVRDRFGVKPLYLARDDGGIWFASEIRALLAAGIKPQPMREVLSHAAIEGWADGRLTPLEGIERMPPGSVVVVDVDSHATTERRWYEPSDAVDPDLSRSLAGADRSDLADRLETALRGAVRRRLMADVPVGTMCSGGLDSSLLMAFARDESSSVTAFTCSLPDEGRADERKWAERAAAALDIELETVTLTTSEWRAALVEAVRHHEYPLTNVSSVPISMIAARARRRGVKVLLTGEAADELFGGYVHLHKAPYVEFLPRSANLRRRLHLVRAQGPEWTSRVLARRILRRRRQQAPLSDELQAAEEIARYREGVRERSASAYRHHPGPRGRLEARLLEGLSCTFPFLLNRMDKDAMAHSVETRLPFLDPAVVGLALNLPLEARTRPEPKGVLRDVGRRNLPARIARRAKWAGMAVRADRRISQAARPEFLERGSLRDLLGISMPRWQELLGRANGRPLVRMWTAEIWCRLFLEGQSVRSVESELWAPERI